MQRYSFVVDEIKVNPQLPVNFDSTPNDERSEEELQEWWAKPYILIEQYAPESWIEFSHRMKEVHGWDDEKLPIKEEWEQQQRQNREKWYKSYPNGFQYNVRCLDGGAWDRSTYRGSFATFEDALQYAKEIRKKAPATDKLREIVENLL